MANTPAQEEFLAITRKSQEAVIAAIKTWVETVRTAAPKLAPLTDKLPKMPSFSVPFADRLPGPEETVANAYRLAEQVLASQRKFAEDLLQMMTPLMPARVESAQVSPAPESAPQSSASAGVPASAIAKSTPGGSAAKGMVGSAKSTAGSAAKPMPAKSTAKRTPANSTAKRTPANSTPKRTPANSTPKDTPANSTPKDTPANSTPKGTAAS